MASAITRQAEGSRSSRQAASTKISGTGFTHYTQTAGLDLYAQAADLRLGPFWTGSASLTLLEIGRSEVVNLASSRAF